MQNVRVVASPNPDGNQIDMQIADDRMAAINRFRRDPNFFGMM